MRENSLKESVTVELKPNTDLKKPSDQTLYTIAQFANVEPAFTTGALRNYVFKSEPRMSATGTIPGNGLIESGAIIRLGRKILIHRIKFLTWIDAQQKLEEKP